MTSEVVIARYAEDLDWVAGIPDQFDVLIYNKGEAVTSSAVLRRADRIVTLENSGRESDTFLRHILAKTDYTDGYTVFLQGDPHEHSPDIIPLLHKRALWRDLQPLSWCYVSGARLPPPDVLSSECHEFVGESKVRSELFSLATWGPVRFFDAGTRRISREYREIHDLPEGVNIAADFFRRCAWPELADQAARYLVGRFAYGGMFAVRQRMIAELPRPSLELALQAANGHKIYGYVLERLWLHIFGASFLLPIQPAVSPATDYPLRLVPAPDSSRGQLLHRRVVPAVKRRIAAWAES